MPLNYKIRKPVVRWVKTGDVDYNDVLDVIKRSLEEARQNHPDVLHWDLIVDLSASSKIRSENELRGVAMALAQYTHILSGRIALVAASTIHLEQGRQFSEFAQQLGHRPRVFEKLQEAEDWLKESRAGR